MLCPCALELELHRRHDASISQIMIISQLTDVIEQLAKAWILITLTAVVLEQPQGKAMPSFMHGLRLLSIEQGS